MYVLRKTVRISLLTIKITLTSYLLLTTFFLCLTMTRDIFFLFLFKLVIMSVVHKLTKGVTSEAPRYKNASCEVTILRNTKNTDLSFVLWSMI